MANSNVPSRYGKAKLARRHGPLGVVAFVVNVDEREAEVREPRRDVLGAPPHLRGYEIEALVSPLTREIAGQRHRHPPRPAADVDHSVVALETAETDEGVEELIADAMKVTVVGGQEPAWRSEWVAPTNERLGKIEEAVASPARPVAGCLPDARQGCPRRDQGPSPSVARISARRRSAWRR